MTAVLVAKRSEPRPYVALGRKIAALRRARKITQRELADRVHISDGYPGSIETGRVRPDPIVLSKIADVLEVEYEELGYLAGYLGLRINEDPKVPAPGAEEVLIRAPVAKAAPVQRILNWSAEQITALERMGRIAFSVPAPPRTRKKTRTERASDGGENSTIPDAERPS